MKAEEFVELFNSVGYSTSEAKDEVILCTASISNEEEAKMAIRVLKACGYGKAAVKRLNGYAYVAAERGKP